MIRRRFLALVPLFLTAALLPLAAQAPDPTVETLDPAHLSTEWQEVINGLRAPPTVRAKFEEHRIFGFRARAVVLQGELRLDRDQGLSLHYTDPEMHTVIIDEQGVLLRDEDGRDRVAPAEAAEATRPLFRALRFELGALAEDWLIRGRLADGAWTLWLESRGRSPDTIELRGTDHQVHSIVLQPASRRRVEIALREIVTGVTFSEAEQRRYFR